MVFKMLSYLSKGSLCFLFDSCGLEMRGTALNIQEVTVGWGVGLYFQSIWILKPNNLKK